MTYIDENSSTQQKQAAGEYALLKLYGNNINISKQSIGDTKNNNIIKLDNNKNVTK